MAYGLNYFFEFQDGFTPSPANWRVEILKKDFSGVAVQINAGGSKPLVLETSGDSEDKDNAIFGTKATFVYVVDNTVNGPDPETFILIEEDTFRLDVYREGILNFSGYIKPDGGSRPFVAPPYEFAVNAVDYFNRAKAEVIDLNDQFTGQFSYSYMTLRSVLLRTILKLIDANTKIRLVSNLKPSVYDNTESDYLLTVLNAHADIFFSATDGPDKMYDALQKLVASLGFRMFYADGSYWLQRVQDIGLDSIQVIESTSENALATYTTRTDNKILVPSEALFTDNKPSLGVDAGLKSQLNKYELKAINRLRNFAWTDVTPGSGTAAHVGEFDGPFDGAGMFISREGEGTAEEPYRLLIAGGGVYADNRIRQLIQNVVPGQFISLDLRSFIYYTKGQAVTLTLWEPGSTLAPTLYMDSGGDWRNAGTFPAVHPDNWFIFVQGDKKTRQGTLSIESKPIPADLGNYELWIEFIGTTNADDPNDPVPSGTDPHNQIWPVTVGIFSDRVNDITTEMTNPRNYSWIPGDDEKTFIDKADPSVSNCFYYNPGSGMVPLPAESWINPNYRGNLFNREGIVLDQLINSSGAKQASAGWSSIRIPVDPGKTYTFGNINLSTGGFSAFYDEADLSMVQFNGSFTPGQTKTYTAPATAGFLWIDIKRPGDTPFVYEQAIVNEGTTLLNPYAPYIGPQGIEEATIRMKLDQYREPTYIFDGELWTNKLSFWQCIQLEDKDNRRFMLMRDEYDVRAAVHTITAKECKVENSAIGVYEAISNNK